jgi:hypothetical protein
MILETKTVALALFDKSRLEAIRLYLSNMRVSDIAKIYFIDKIQLKGRIKRTMEMIDMNMLMDDEIL